MPYTTPNESAEYRSARNRLAQLEREANALQAQAAAQRRNLPPGGEVTGDYRFQRIASNGTPETVSIGELFGGRDTLIVYSMMFGPERKKACPFCTAYLTGLEHAVGKLDNAAFVVAARAPIERLVDHANASGWKNISMASDGDSTFHMDYNGVDPESGGDSATFNVFVRDGDTVRHHWGAEDQDTPGSETWFDAWDTVANLGALAPRA